MALPNWIHGHLPAGFGEPEPEPVLEAEEVVGIRPCVCRGEGCRVCKGDGVLYP